MGAFVIDEPFIDIKEYSDYPYSHLYDHGRLLGKAITDNWTYRTLCNRIKSGDLCKARLSDGYKLYTATALVFIDYFTKPEFTYVCVFPARDKKEAERKMIHTRFYNMLLPSDWEHEYGFKDSSGIVKIRVVEQSD